jgi:prepilin-type N-terminal cleavage/methylation domain-containing protein
MATKQDNGAPVGLADGRDCGRHAMPRVTTARRRPRGGFTLVELLTVVAIIALLIGILVPAISSARISAKNGSTKATLQRITQGCELFRNEFDEYPRSQGLNPFEPVGSQVFLSGAQWLGLQMIGADFQGYCRKDKKSFYDSQPAPGGDGKIDNLDWLDWYSDTPSKQFRRFPLFVDLAANSAISPEQYAKSTGSVGALPEELTTGSRGGASQWSNGQIPFLMDSFRRPILYYAVQDEAATQPFVSRVSNTLTPGIYDQTDNAAFTGASGEGFNPNNASGIELGGSGPHQIARLGWNANQPFDRPADQTFARFVYDRQTFEANPSGPNRGVVVPVRKESFLLISPGRDARYGTADDVKNF